VVDPLPERREVALSWGADQAVHPDEVESAVQQATGGRGADICIEVSGAAAALQSAIRCTGQEGTIECLSFFGTKTVPLVLSPEFHYRRQRIISSQVSSLGSGLQPRWDPERRMQQVFGLLAKDWLVTNVSHRTPFAEAPAAYRLIDEGADAALGVLFTYDTPAATGPGGE
jgi:threonine dehydrogenase-like Zn-dependent dehydrogenase